MSTATGQVRSFPSREGGEIQHTRLSRVKSWFTPETLIVAGREVKGLVVPQWLAVLLAGALLGGGGFVYKSMSNELQSQHDILVKLQTQKEDAEKAAKQEHDDRALEVSEARSWRENMKDRMLRLELGMQTPKKAGG